MQAKQKWEQCHQPDYSSTNNNSIPSNLYTDENPATTIKGTGFKNKEIAKRTILLTSQPGVRYKQYWTIKAMRERAIHHPHRTADMQDAIYVFDEWLSAYKTPLVRERIEMEEEWKVYRKLVDSDANLHSYGSVPSCMELKRSRNDLKEGKGCLLRGLHLAQKKKTMISEDTEFPLSSFTALFGGPGLHGYGRHTLNDDHQQSQVVIEGIDGLEEVLGKKAKTLPFGVVSNLQKIIIHHNRKREMARFEIQQDKRIPTLDNLWEQPPPRNNNNHEISSPSSSWTCSACTLVHKGSSKKLFLACELCGTARREETITTATRSSSSSPVVSSSPVFSPSSPPVTKLKPVIQSPPPPPSAAAWGCLRAPTKKDIHGPNNKRRRKALYIPPPMMDHLIVLDFEWTADDQRKMEPIAEITQFPSVVMKLLDRGTTTTMTTQSQLDSCIPLCSSYSPDAYPDDLLNGLVPNKTTSTTKSTSKDAHVISVFDTYVKPTLNPILTKFSIELTAITQSQVNTAPTIDIILNNYTKWLQSLHLIDSNQNKTGNWTFCTWGDVDIMTTLRLELQHKRIPIPKYFQNWINLKDASVFARHYGRKPRGGLRNCVESTGTTWGSGWAHNGLVDSVNTAKIVRDMVKTGFRFTRSTRGLDRNGIPFGLRKGNVDEEEEEGNDDSKRIRM